MSLVCSVFALLCVLDVRAVSVVFRPLQAFHAFHASRVSHLSGVSSGFNVSVAFGAHAVLGVFDVSVVPLVSGVSLVSDASQMLLWFNVSAVRAKFVVRAVFAMVFKFPVQAAFLMFILFCGSDFSAQFSDRYIYLAILKCLQMNVTF